MRRDGRLYLLGATRVEHDGATTVLRGVQPRVVLARLVLARGRPVSADELAEVLWPEQRSSHWEGALRGVVTKVRAFVGRLGPEVGIDNIGRTYRLVGVTETAVDVWHADALIAEIDGGVGSGPVVEDVAREAAQLLLPEMLPGVEGEWLVPVRVHLGRQRRRAQRLLSSALTEVGGHDEAVAQAEAAVRGDPLDEDSQRRLIEAHLAGGDRGSALRAYGEGRRLLVEELGVAPSAATEALYLAALASGDGPSSHSPVGAPRPIATLQDRPFVGRAEQLSGLSSRSDGARRGNRQLVLLRGEPGAGKTRLALELVRRVAPTHSLYGRSSAEQLLPFEPVTEALGRHLAPLADDDLRDLLGPFGAEMATFVPTLADRIGGPTPVPPGRDDRARIFESVAAVLGRIAAEPTVLVLDDLQWADEASLQLVVHLVKRLDRARLLVIVTYRDDRESPIVFADAMADLHRVDAAAMSVGGLAPAEVTELLGRSGVTDAAELGPVFHRRTSGNAFYLHQVLALHDEDPERFDPKAVPDTVAELVRHLLTGLPPASRKVLSVASVFGISVEHTVLERAVIAEGGDLDAIDDVLERRLLVDAETGGYAFTHAIVRDAVYGQLPRGRRRRLHLAAAVATKASGDDDAERSAAVAHHFLMADDPAHAAEWYAATIRAADQALGARDHERATELYASGVALIDRFALVDGDEATVRLGLGKARHRAGGGADAVANLEVAIELARDAGDGVVFGNAVLELVARGWRGAATEMPDDARATLLQEAIDRAPAEDAALLVALLASASTALALTDRAVEREGLAERAGRLAEDSGRADLIAATVEAHRQQHPRPDEAGLRLALTEDLIAPDRSIDLPRWRRAQLHAFRITDHVELGDRDRADRELTALRSAAEATGRDLFAWLVATWDALYAFLDGDPDEADAIALGAVGAGDGETDIGRMLAYGAQLMGFRLQQRRGAEVVHLLRSGVEMAPGLAAVESSLALALAQAGEHEEAAAIVGRLAADDFALVADDVGWHGTMAFLAAASCELGDAGTAALLLPKLEPLRDCYLLFGAHGTGGACWGPIDGVVGALRAGVGDRAGAQRAFDRALRSVEAFRAPALTEQLLQDRDRLLA